MVRVWSAISCRSKETEMVRSSSTFSEVWVLVFGIVIFCAVSVSGQTQDVCIKKQPLPELPADYGTLDAQTTVLLRVDFNADRSIGDVKLVKSSNIWRLDDLALEAGRKIVFEPKSVDGKKVATHKWFEYRYSWRNPGWKVTKLENVNYCSQDSDASKFEGWKKIEERTFSFYAPEDIKGGAKRGIDTAVYQYEGGGFIISFDIGALANPAPRFTSKEVTIDSQTGLIAHGVRQSRLYVKLNKYTNFNMYVASGDPGRREIAEKMFMSLRFKAKDP